MPENGYMTARAYMSEAQLPLSNVAVTIVSSDGTAIAMRLTNRSGLTEPVAIPTPERSESEQPEENGRPFTDITIYAWKSGFEQVAARNVQVFSGITTIQDLEMVPLSELPDRWDENVLYNTPPQNL